MPPRHRRPRAGDARPRSASPTCAPTPGTTAWPSSRGPPGSISLGLHRGRLRTPSRRRDRARAVPASACTAARPPKPGRGGCVSSSGSTTRSATGSSWCQPAARLVARPVAFSRAAGITEFGHLCLDAPDVHEAYRFWSTRFNARVSDWLGDAACLMRIDPVHHKLAVFRERRAGPVPHELPGRDHRRRLPQLALPGRARRRDRDGPGRHPQSTAIFLYFLGPEGFTYEYSFGVRRIEDDAAWSAPVLRPRRARLHRHVARQPRPASSSVGWIEAEDATARPRKETPVSDPTTGTTSPSSSSASRSTVPTPTGSSGGSDRFLPARSSPLLRPAARRS